MGINTQIDTKAAVQGIVDWWNLAGVDIACADAPMDPFAPHAEPAGISEKLSHQASVRTITTTAPVTVRGPAPSASLPDSIEALHAKLASDPAMAGAGYSRYRALPCGDPSAKIAIITDLPEIEDIESGVLFAGRAGQLLGAMLKAIGLTMDHVYIAPLAVSRPPSGLLPPEDAAALGDQMRHHLSLLKAERLIMLGNSVAHILTGSDLFAARGILHEINHRCGKVSGVTTFHPRTMLASPSFKAQCWVDLQFMMKDLNR